MATDAYRIRKATLNDAAAIRNIYAPYVENTVVSFEFTVPSLKEFQERMVGIMAQYPYLVAEDYQGNLLGYAYASPYKERAAYAWSVELSIYLAAEQKGQGIGTALYQKLFAFIKKQGFYHAYACIVSPYEESVAFHKKLGFCEVGYFPACGYKQGAWRDILWLEKVLQSETVSPMEIRPFSDFTREEIKEMLTEDLCKA